MRPDELKEWRERSDRLFAIGVAMEPGDPRDATVFAAGALRGLAERLVETETAVRQYQGNGAATILEIAQLRREAREHLAEAAKWRDLANRLAGGDGSRTG
jgi:hypothetical protein